MSARFLSSRIPIHLSRRAASLPRLGAPTKRLCGYGYSSMVNSNTTVRPYPEESPEPSSPYKPLRIHYGPLPKRSHEIHEITSGLVGQTVTLEGWLTTSR
ncbi:hypothetical protein [Phaffia rhodozyma]|uniref:Uncharacterized protein n=1 Tax=Phaffia rhodozyma TaxID=264483 RepID=A0A0F7STP2_PHARH|nr:hypothetical protein [Phaffia rhodozyma]